MFQTPEPPSASSLLAGKTFARISYFNAARAEPGSAQIPRFAD
jgi:hypothetical protein